MTKISVCDTLRLRRVSDVRAQLQASARLSFFFVRESPGGETSGRCRQVSTRARARSRARTHAVARSAKAVKTAANARTKFSFQSAANARARVHGRTSARCSRRTRELRTTTTTARLTFHVAKSTRPKNERMEATLTAAVTAAAAASALARPRKSERRTVALAAAPR